MKTPRSSTCKLVALFLLGHVFNQQLSAQDLGVHYNNYIGVNGVSGNPASIAASRYKVHVNLLSASAYAGSNAYEFNTKKFFSLKFNDWKEGEDYRKNLKDGVKNGYANADVQGPSVMINLNKKSAFAFTTRFRTIANMTNVSAHSLNLLGKPLPGIYGVDFREENVRLKASAFADAGITYARVLKDQGKNFIKAGATVKYIQGITSVSLKVDRLNVNIENVKSLQEIQGNGSLLYAANIDRVSKSGPDKDMLRDISMRNGTVGMDLGFVYERRSDKFRAREGDFATIPYQFRVSVAVTDLALAPAVFKAGNQSAAYSLSAGNVKLDTFSFKNQQNVEAYLQNLQFSNVLDKQSAAGEINMTLPASLRTNIDWHISKHFFVNADALVSFRSARSNSAGASYISTLHITPRFESKWLSVYSPLSVNVYDEFNWGAGVRIGPLFIGSGSVISNAFKTNFSNMDAHVGLSIPVYQGKRIKRKKQPAAVEYVVTAPVIQQPVPVIQQDSLVVVKVETARQTESNIKVQAPEIQAEIKKVVDKAAKNLFFSFGSAKIDSRSYPFLDELATMLNDEPNLLVAIEGHTDNVGTDLKNRRLSLERAEAAKGYLVNQDINPLRITTHGFGSTLPVSTNATEAGRAENRRIVIRVRKHWWW